MFKKMWLLSLVMVFSFLLACKELITLNTPTNLKIVENVLLWDGDDNAKEYIVDINNSSFKVENNSYEIENLVQGIAYNIRVRSLGDGVKYKNSDWSILFIYNLPDLKVDTPTNIKTENKIITWDVVENASSYKLSINDVEYSVLVNQYEILDFLINYNYAISIKAIGSDNYNDSDWSEVVNYKIENVVLTSPSNLKFSNGVVIWDIVANAKEYILEITIDTNTFSYYTSTNMYVLSDIDNNSFKLRVKAIGDGNVYLDSEYSNYLEVGILNSVEYIQWRMYNISWSEVENASMYRVSINDRFFDVGKNEFYYDVLEFGELYLIKVLAMDGDVTSLWSETLELIFFEMYVVQCLSDPYTIKFYSDRVIKKGEDFTFEIILPLEYNKAELIVYANDNLIVGDNGMFTIVNVLDNYIIGIEPISLNTYEVKFEIYDGIFEEGDSLIIVYHGNFVEAPIVSKHNNEPIGWFVDELFKVEWDFNSDVVVKDMVLYMKWLDLDVNIAEEGMENVLKMYENLYMIDEDIELITFEEETKTMVSWSSANQSALSNSGVVSKTPVIAKFKLTVTVSYNSMSVSHVFDVKVEIYKDLSGPIASGYIYTNYSLANDNFFDTMDIIYCAFGLLQTNGLVSRTGQSLTSLNNSRTYIEAKAHARGSYMILSIGGGGQSDQYQTVCVSDTLRKIFAKDCVDLINQYGFDGIDIDWEYPTNREQELGFTLLAEEIRKQVKANNPKHLVTAAIGGGMWQPARYDMPNSHHHLDYINMMTYGMHNAGRVYHNALYKSTKGYTLNTCTIVESVAIYNSYTVPNNKIIIGLAFYAMRQDKNSSGQWIAGSGSLSYQTVVQYIANGSYIEYYDEEVEQPYMMNIAETTFYSYDNPRSILAKCDYVKEKGLAGVMYWQNGQDTTGLLVQAIKDGFNK